ncbi:ABC transporter substrate-binding protein [Celeribacter litoreus]|uniref:ABC transporter substrate-binding protein n=1 Tax=Celeribacter litoreus TaxID=2876714 RepID=UPI001CCB0CF8|nr:ABC transporter substrate-binding protein [Celeribacter litoreus]MCA0042520.1 ABC transporter substrate-binding protein [Celeribacter litoreus]
MSSPFLASVALAALLPVAASAQEILILAEDVPSGLDYDGPSAAVPASQQGMVNTMEPLVFYPKGEVNEDGVQLPDFSTIEGRLAESWTYDEETLTWTFKLREGVVGCGGATFNADDVLYTFARAKSVSGAAPIGWFLSNVSSIAGFDASVFGDDPAAKELGDEIVKIDDYTVQIKQSEPNALFLPALTAFGLLMFDKETMEAHATDADPWTHDWANATSSASFGAYCVSEWAKNEKIVYTANEDYFLGAPAIKKVTVQRVPQSSNRAVVLMSGQAQLASGLTPREYDSMRGRAGLAVSGVTGNESTFVHMNFDVEPFDNPKLREAIAYAVPYDQIIANGYFGQAEQWNGVVPSSYPGYKDVTSFTYDPEKAKALLAEAGYPEGAGLEAFGDAFQLTYVAEKESTLGPIVNIIQTALRGVGVPVTLNPIPLSQYGDRQLVKRDLGFAINDQEKPVVVDAGYGIQLFFVSPDKGGLNNMVNYSSDIVDETWAAARVEPDMEKRDAMVAEIQEQIASDIAWLPVVEYRTQWAHSERLKGQSWYADNAPRYFDLYIE